MDLVRWKDYKVYFFDEDDGSNYVGDFIDNLYRSDIQTAERILKLFIKRLSEGKGITQECYDEHITSLTVSDIFEYKDRSATLRNQIRIYFGAHRKTKTIVFVCAGFKKSKAEQNRDIETAQKRYKRYIARFD
jgi:N-glycosylase/DNA lyase